MAGLCFAVLFATTSAFLLLASSASSPSPPPRPPELYVVGDDMGWAVPPPGATDALNVWAARHRFLVGDILMFRYTYTGRDDEPLRVSLDDYERCSAATPPPSPFAGGGGGGGGVVRISASFILDLPGPLYFISGAPWRCEAGQRMAVFVEDARAPTPAPAPAPGTTTQGPDTPPPGHHHRLSLAQKQFAAAAIGFGAGIVLVFLIMWLCVCFNC
ncbi:unnamed protein product [Urochloa humidicola]